MLTNVSLVKIIVTNCVTMCLVPLCAGARPGIPCRVMVQHVKVQYACIRASLVCVNECAL